jgi:hypothetical protein
MVKNMKIKKLIRHYLFRESIKDIELNRILDKIDKKEALSNREMRFLELYQFTCEEDRDFMLLSKNSAASKVTQLIDGGKTVICDLEDRYGRIGLGIIGIENNHQNDDCTIKMRGGETHTMKDSSLYNIIFNVKKNKYSLQEHDEYIEKIEAGNDEN